MIHTATWSRRFLALLIDWAVSSFVVVAIIGPTQWSDDPYAGFYTMGIYIVESAFFTALAGGSFGKLLTRLRVVRYDGTYRPLELLPAFLRSVLIALVIPPLVFRHDGRGLHDLAVGSYTVTLADLRSVLS